MNQSRPVTGDLVRGEQEASQGVAQATRGRHAATSTRERNNHKDEFPTEPALIAEEIARTRRELGETLEALTARMDVKSRAREGVSQAQTRVVEMARPAARPVLGALTGAGVAAAALVVVFVLRRTGVPMLRRRMGRRRRGWFTQSRGGWFTQSRRGSWLRRQGGWR